MEGSEFYQIRKYLRKSQSQIAGLLSISSKTVQSYEQRLRKVPPHIAQQMEFFLSLKRAHSEEPIKPCWEITDCPPEWRTNCFVWELKANYFCWFVNGTFCQGHVQKNWNEKHRLCRECEVYKSLFPKDIFIHIDY